MKILIELESAGDVWIAHAVLTREDGVEGHLETEIAMLGDASKGVEPLIEAIGRAIAQAIESPIDFLPED